ncbi:hypothetical protein [Brevundimonas sp.]|uniref:hypothetical protein n=1 Tax=Brevundimonas sp. TaxID=1871086 RepID=UPI00391A5628
MAPSLDRKTDGTPQLSLRLRAQLDPGAGAGEFDVQHRDIERLSGGRARCDRSLGEGAHDPVPGIDEGVDELGGEVRIILHVEHDQGRHDGPPRRRTAQQQGAHHRPDLG